MADADNPMSATTTGTDQTLLVREAGQEKENPIKPPAVWGEFVPHDHCSSKNLLNAFLCAVALVPSIVATVVVYTRCDRTQTDVWGSADEVWCSLAMGYPIAWANALFFLNVSVGFWVVGLLQRSFWLIDPYWTLIPPLLGHLYQLHPNAHYDTARSIISLVLLWAWCVRLTHSYFRREDWKFGQREDWRYTKMAMDYPKLWPLLSFFAVGVAQQPMLVGITLPAYTIHFVDAPFGEWYDYLAIACSVAGLFTAWLSDNQLRSFMLRNEDLVKRGLPRVPLIENGLWNYSRHPNYFGEQLWWWGYAIFSAGLGQWYMFAGTFFNSLVLASVTVMTEQRMLRNWTQERADLYREYMRTTSPLIPLPRFPWFGRQPPMK